MTGKNKEQYSISKLPCIHKTRLHLPKAILMYTCHVTLFGTAYSFTYRAQLLGRPQDLNIYAIWKSACQENASKHFYSFTMLPYSCLCCLLISSLPPSRQKKNYNTLCYLQGKPNRRDFWTEIS